MKSFTKLVCLFSLMFGLGFAQEPTVLEEEKKQQTQEVDLDIMTPTLTVGEQRMMPYRKALTSIETRLQTIVAQLKSNPSDIDLKQMAQKYVQKYRAISAYIKDQEILFKLFAANDLLQNYETYTPMFDYQDYEETLYITNGPLDKNTGSYEGNINLLDCLTKDRTTLQCGEVAWAKILAYPTTNIDVLQKRQNACRELLQNEKIFDDLHDVISAIKKEKLEDAFLSFWKEDEVATVVNGSPYARNSSFAPIIKMLSSAAKISIGKDAEINSYVDELDKSQGFIGTMNYATFLKDAALFMAGIEMVKGSFSALKNAFSSLDQDMSYFGGLKRLWILPVVLPTIKLLTHKIIDFSLKNRLKKEYAALETIRAQRALSKPTKIESIKNTVVLTFAQEHDAQTYEKQIVAPCSHLESTSKETKLIIKLTQQEERSFRFSHPLMQHETMITVVIPCVAYLLICSWWGMPLFAPLGAMPGTPISLWAPGFCMLPWHAIQILTNIGLVPAYAFQHFYEVPKQSIDSTTQAIQKARKYLLDIAHLLAYAEKIKKIIEANDILRENMTEVRALDTEGMLKQKISALQNTHGRIQKEAPQVLDRINQVIAYFCVVQQELSKLLDTLQAHVYETEGTTPYRWLSLTGFFKNLRIRFCSHDLLAAYKIMLNIKDVFAPLIEAIGMVDQKLAQVKLIKEFEAQPVHFCFATFEKKAKPHLTAAHVWLPHLLEKIKPEDIVTNSIELGKDNGTAQTMIVSGPTEGGKSTFERTVGIAALMALVMGIAPADKFICTPFDRVLLSFNATDKLGTDVTQTGSSDQKTGTSGFRAEVESIKRIVTTKKALPVDKKVLVVIDELFQKGPSFCEYFSSEVIRQNFTEHANCLSVIVSHREQPKYLEAETAGLCINYHFIPEKSADGTWHNTYRLEPGAAFLQDFRRITLDDIRKIEDSGPSLQMIQEAGLIQPVGV